MKPPCLLCEGRGNLPHPLGTQRCPRCYGTGYHRAPARHRRSSRWNRVLRRLGVR